MSLPSPLFKHYCVDNFISKDRCRQIVSLTENFGKWTANRHENYPTTDIPVKDVPGLTIDTELEEISQKCISLYELENTSKIDAFDLFVVKYEINGQQKLDLHRDVSVLSFIITLSDPDEYEGGGTFYEHENKIVKANSGALSLHCGKIRHSGIEITSGCRYILIGFLNVRSQYIRERSTHKLTASLPDIRHVDFYWRHKTIARNLKIFIINIDKRKTRLDQCKKEIQNLEVPPNWKVVTQVLNARVPPDGEHSRFLSHMEIIHSNEFHDLLWRDVALILEDDAQFHIDLLYQIDLMLREIDSWDLINLGGISENGEFKKISNRLIQYTLSRKTHCILYSVQGIKKIKNKKIDQAISYNYNDFLNSLPLEIYYPHVPLSWQKDDGIHDVSLESRHNLLVLATGTSMTDGLKRFMDSCRQNYLNFKIMGLNCEWKGGTMQSEGGGQKINLLIDQLKSLDDKQLILVTDSYDVIMSATEKEIIDKYNSFDKNIIFATESYCWPDKYVEGYPDVNVTNKYLNSGGFIGLVGKIKSYLKKVDDGSDDQRFYTKLFIENQHDICLDYTCKLFQCCNHDEYNIINNRMYNKIHQTYPCHIHGNGGTSMKLLLNKIGNYILKNHIQSCRSNIIVYVQITDDLKNGQIDRARNMIFENIQKYSSTHGATVMFSGSNDPKHGFLESYNVSADYFWLIDTSIVLTCSDTLLDMISTGKGVVSSLINCPKSAYSNFWGAVKDNGFYLRSSDYFDIRNCVRPGIYNVPHIGENILIEKTYIEKLQGFFAKSIDDDDFSLSMQFSYQCRKKNIFMYVVNWKEYGFVER